MLHMKFGFDWPRGFRECERRRTAEHGYTVSSPEKKKKKKKKKKKMELELYATASLLTAPVAINVFAM